MPKSKNNTNQDLKTGIPEINEIDKPIKLLLRDRDTGELVYSGTMDLDGKVDLLEVGPAYVDLLRQIGINIGNA